MKNFYPVNLDISGRLCVVVGGGDVAGRKVRGLLRCGAKVMVISPWINASLALLVEAEKVGWQQRGYREGDLAGAFLVFAATDQKEVQKNVCAEALERGVLLNTADAPTSCSFHVPARVRRGSLLLTISTGGGSPALSAHIRRQVENTYGPEYGQYVKLLADIRTRIVGDGDSTASHTVLFRELLHLNILSHLRNKDWDALAEDLRSVLPAPVKVEELVEGCRQLG